MTFRNEKYADNDDHNEDPERSTTQQTDENNSIFASLDDMWDFHKLCNEPPEFDFDSVFAANELTASTTTTSSFSSQTTTTSTNRLVTPAQQQVQQQEAAPYYPQNHFIPNPQQQVQAQAQQPQPHYFYPSHVQQRQYFQEQHYYFPTTNTSFRPPSPTPPPTIAATWFPQALFAPSAAPMFQQNIIAPQPTQPAQQVHSPQPISLVSPSPSYSQLSQEQYHSPQPQYHSPQPQTLYSQSPSPQLDSDPASPSKLQTPEMWESWTAPPEDRASPNSLNRKRKEASPSTSSKDTPKEKPTSPTGNKKKLKWKHETERVTRKYSKNGEKSYSNQIGVVSFSINPDLSFKRKNNSSSSSSQRP